MWMCCCSDLAQAEQAKHEAEKAKKEAKERMEAQTKKNEDKARLGDLSLPSVFCNMSNELLQCTRLPSSWMPACIFPPNPG